MPVNVHRHDCLCPRRDLTSDLIDIHGPRPWFTIDKYWNTSGIDYRQGARDDGKARHDDLITRSQAESCYGDLQSRRAVTHSYAIHPTTVASPFRLKFFDEAPRRGDPSGAHTFAHILQFPIA